MSIWVIIISIKKHSGGGRAASNGELPAPPVSSAWGAFRRSTSGIWPQIHLGTACSWFCRRQPSFCTHIVSLIRWWITPPSPHAGVNRQVCVCIPPSYTHAARACRYPPRTDDNSYSYLNNIPVSLHQQLYPPFASMHTTSSTPLSLTRALRARVQGTYPPRWTMFTHI